jgi:hypothetical protein
VRALLERLHTTLLDGEVGATGELLQELARFDLPEDICRAVARLRRFVEDYEYHKAAEAVDQLLACLPSQGNS